MLLYFVWPFCKTKNEDICSKLNGFLEEKSPIGPFWSIYFPVRSSYIKWRSWCLSLIYDFVKHINDVTYFFCQQETYWLSKATLTLYNSTLFLHQERSHLLRAIKEYVNIFQTRNFSLLSHHFKPSRTVDLCKSST